MEEQVEAEERKVPFLANLDIFENTY